MSKSAKIICGGPYDGFDAPSITDEEWGEIERKTNFRFSEDCRSAILTACRRFLNDTSAADSVARAGEVREDLQFLDRHFGKLLDWWDSASASRRHAVKWIMRRRLDDDAIGEGKSSKHARRLRQLFDDMKSIRREVGYDLNLLKSGDHPSIEKEISPWGQWVRIIIGLVEREGFDVSVRNDDEGAFNPSPLFG